MAGCSSPFVGAEPRHTMTDLMPRGARTDTIAQNIQRRLALAPQANPRPFRCIVDIGPDGEATPDSLSRCAAGGRPIRSLKPPIQPPPATREKLTQTIPVPTQPEWYTAQTSGTLGVGPTTLSRFSEVIRRPGVLESVNLTLDTADPSSQNTFLFIRFGEDDTAGPQSNDYSIYTYQDSLDTVVQLFRGERQGGQFNLPVNFPVLSVPFRVHLRLVNNSGINGMGVSAIWMFRAIQPDELKQFRPPHLSQASQISRFAHAVRPPSRTLFRFPGFPSPQAGDKYSQIELLAQQLRESPFGIPHAQMIAKAQEAGFGLNAERAVNLAITQAARPPNIALLASRL